MFSATLNIRNNLNFILLWNLHLTYETAAVLNTTLLCIKNWYFIAKNGTILIKYKYKDWIYLFLTHSIKKDIWSTCKFQKALRSLRKELGFFHMIFAQTLTAHKICLTHITPSIVIYANALGYLLSIKVEFVMQNMTSICLYCCIWKGGLKSKTFRKLIKTNNIAYF